MTQSIINPPRVDNLLPESKHVIALVAEQLKVDIRSVETGRVRIATRVVETDHVVSPPLMREEVEIERVSMNQEVDHALPIREEDGVTIVPVYEEVLIVTKQLVLKEELRIRRRESVQIAKPQHFTLRHEEITISHDRVSPETFPSEPVARQ